MIKEWAAGSVGQTGQAATDNTVRDEIITTTKLLKISYSSFSNNNNNNNYYACVCVSTFRNFILHFTILETKSFVNSLTTLVYATILYIYIHLLD